MQSDGNRKELNRKLDAEIAAGERNRRIALAIVAIIISGVIMAVGVVVLGGAEKVHQGADTAYSYWDSPEFEIGVFTTLIGAVMMALSANFLTTSWRTSEV